VETSQRNGREGRTEFVFVRYPGTKNDLPDNNLLCFQCNLVEVVGSEKARVHIFLFPSHSLEYRKYFNGKK
jgi:hypothetical protein